MCGYLNRIYKWSLLLVTLLFAIAACSTISQPPASEVSSDTTSDTMVAEQIDPSLSMVEVDNAEGIEVEDLPTPPEDNQASLKSSAPEQYVVQKGDTLWDLSNHLLNQPWYWPEIWYMNPQVENPHLIYPGDVINVFYVSGRPYLTVNSENRIAEIERLSPIMRGEPIEANQKVIPIQAIEQFLIQPQVIDKTQLDTSPYIVGSRDDRLIYGSNDVVYVRGSDDLSEGTKYNIFRPGSEFRDPISDEILGYEAIHVGDGELTQAGNPASLYLTSTNREVSRGDRILEIEEVDADTAFYPRSPETDINGQIIYLYDAITQVGSYQIVVTNIGKQQGIEKGHVVSINKSGRAIIDPHAKEGQEEQLQLPDEQSADAMVFRVFDQISYLFILDAYRPVHIGDIVKVP